MTGLPLKIAFRYLFARKSYNVINVISGIGTAGMAIGTAALIVILSVFNGFNRIVSLSLSDATPDLVVRPATGKVFVPDSAAVAWMMASPDVVTLSSVLEEQVFVSYEGRQSLARVKGLDSVGEEESALKDYLTDGTWQLHKGDLPMAVAGVGLARVLGLNPRFVTPFEIHYPSRTEAVSLANPTAALRTVQLQTAGIISVNAELDAKTLLVPLECMRELLQYPTEISALEVQAAPGQADALRKELQEVVGPSCQVLDRYRQHESIYRMMRYEKLAIYLILIFVVVIIAFNIYSALKMLVIEKQGDMATLRSLGAPEPMLRKVFLWEGCLVSALGVVIGIALGVVLVWLQDRLGLVPMPGNFLVSSYPVALKVTDILWTLLGVGGVAFLMAYFPSRKV